MPLSCCSAARFTAPLISSLVVARLATNLRSTTETLGVGTRIATPSSLPSSSGSTTFIARSDGDSPRAESDQAGQKPYERQVWLPVANIHGVVEALELPGEHFVLAVQWHPEKTPDDLRLFQAVVDAARSYVDSR